MKDLSNTPVLSHWPSFQSSMAGGNMVTNKLDEDGLRSGQGSDSEATHDVIAHKMTDFGDAHDTPDLPGPATPASDVDVDEKGTSYAPTPRTWKDLS